MKVPKLAIIPLLLAGCGGGSDGGQTVPITATGQPADVRPQIIPQASAPAVTPAAPATPAASAQSAPVSAPAAEPATPAPASAPATPVEPKQPPSKDTAPEELITRHTNDLPDDNNSSQVHLLYITPSNGLDRSYDINGSIEKAAAAIQVWLSNELNGRKLNFDTYKGKVDITFVRLGQPNYYYSGYGNKQHREIEKELLERNLLDHTKRYLAYYEGENAASCGDSDTPTSVTPGVLSIVYLQGRCIEAEGPEGSKYVAIHEMLHNLGAVSPSAPDYTPPGHVTQETDIMYYGTLSIKNAYRIDVQHRNYYNPAGLPKNLFNLADSPYLTK